MPTATADDATKRTYARLRALADHPSTPKQEQVAASSRVRKLEATYPGISLEYDNAAANAARRARVQQATGVDPADYSGFVKFVLSWSFEKLVGVLAETEAAESAAKHRGKRNMKDDKAEEGKRSPRKRFEDMSLDEILDKAMDDERVDIACTEDFPDAKKSELQIELTFHPAEWARIMEDPEGFIAYINTVLSEDPDDEDEDEEDEED